MRKCILAFQRHNIMCISLLEVVVAIEFTEEEVEFFALVSSITSGRLIA